MLLINKDQQGVAQSYSKNCKLIKLNLIEDGDSSPNLKVRVLSGRYNGFKKDI